MKSDPRLHNRTPIALLKLLMSPTASQAETLTSSVEQGARTVLATQIFSQLISIASLALLLRWIAPAEYGLLAAVTPALMLPRMFAALGTSAATVQRHAITSDETSAIFWLQLAASMVAALITAACGPWLAWQLSEPRLALLCYALAGSTIAGSLGATHLAILERELKLVALSRVRLLAQLAGAVSAIAVAYQKPTAAALVAQQYGELLTLSIGGWLVTRWRPAWPRFSRSHTTLAQFSGLTSLAQVIFYVAQNLHLLLLPLLLPENFRTALGLYTQASNLMLKPVLLVTSPLTSVLLAGISRAREARHDPSPVVARLFRMTAILLFPVASGTFATAMELMPLLGGSNWKTAGTILAILAPVILVQGMLNLAAYVMMAYSRLVVLVAMSLVSLVMLVQSALLALWATNISFSAGDEALEATIRLAMATSVVTCLVIAPPQLWLMLQSTGLSARTILLPLLRPLRAAVIMGAIVMLARSVLLRFDTLGDLARLSILVPLGVALYLLLAWPDVRWLRGILAGGLTSTVSDEKPTPKIPTSKRRK